MRRGLALGGGGVTGIAWETGLLLGLQDLGVDVTVADAVVGTSAGSVVGAQLTTGISLSDLFAYQVSQPRPAPLARISPVVLWGFARALLRARGDLEAFGRHVGAWSARRADAGRLPSLESRFDAIRERLPVQEWGPGGRLQVTAVEVETGALRVFDGSDGVPLVAAVAASCAVPGVYPPVPIQGRQYVDGGARSGSNADLVADCDRVLAFTPVDRAVGPLRSAGQLLGDVPHLVVSPDADSVRAIGKNVLDPARRAASARAGRAQAAAVAPLAREIWA
ncbi:patatin-like phospholipase family protein [Nocardioides sp. MAH-18]|uniref:Patatin-like phospholipase family protein n=1 Tax=Nocardioides agri TaxID=2682843 RepID=A0A6L6XUH3_9ACTN|nr:MULTISPECIES: patatin-like phospholipase family protein [unclassified Nocardioides]MBA2955839.1 patatin-like phospholipase family protein [Nocardioides sp. CGMCC 1.13656]MVQ50688.1 patatin-like phospholipase family protein [Nocardioides sp. MAH-18]